MLQVLQWAMDNTVKGSQAGVTEWASQGMHFAVTKGAPDRALQPEKLQLDELYGSSKTAEPVEDLVAAMACKQKLLCSTDSGRTGSSSSGASVSGSAAGARQQPSGLMLNRQHIIAQVEEKGKQLGQGYMVVAGHGVNEEVERELQQEEEEEEEREVEPPQVQAAQERDWQYRAALTAASVKELCNAAGNTLAVVPLGEVVGLLQAGGLAGIPWSRKVHCTANFVYTTAASLLRADVHGSSAAAGVVGGSLDEYLRPVDALLVFPKTGDVLLVSEREADALQEQVWVAAGKGAAGTIWGRSSDAPVLVNLAYAQLAAEDNPSGQQQGVLLASQLGSYSVPAVVTRQAAQKRQRLCVSLQLGGAELVSLLIFNGCASYGSEAQRQRLRRMMRGRRAAAEVLVSLRGKQAMLARSHLELACDEVAATTTSCQR